MSALRRFFLLTGLTAAATVFYQSASVLRAQPAARNGLALERALPEMNGKKLVMKIVDVRLAPGAKGSPHKHGCAVAVYVVSGAVRMQVRGGADSVYRAGGTFFERPTDIHQVSTNVSATDSAHFTATFVCDHTGPLSTPVP